MSLQNRLEKLEAERGKGGNGECRCTYPSSVDVRFYENHETSEKDADADTREPERCGECGGERRLIKVVYVEGKKAA
jgi:hypothetical protein